MRGRSGMGRVGKKHKDSVQKIDRLKRYNFEEAVQLAIDCAHAKFDESVDLAVRLGVDPRHGKRPLKQAQITRVRMNL
jgi:large subunit ribosomal protein L1